MPRLALGELWSSRELTYFFFLRDLKVRYKQSLLGISWVLLQPLIGALAFTFLFNGLAGIEADGSYFVLALTGFLVWNAISGSMNSGAGSLIGHQDLITHVRFPMVAAPASVFPLAFVDLAVGSSLALVWAVVDGEGLDPVGLVVGVPASMAMIVLTAAGPALLFAAATVRYRDAGALLGVLTQVVFFLSPVSYPPDLVDERWRELQYANPVAGCLSLFRWGFGGPTPEPGLLVISAAVAVLGALGGLVYFRYNEPTLVDVI